MDAMLEARIYLEKAHPDLVIVSQEELEVALRTCVSRIRARGVLAGDNPVVDAVTSARSPDVGWNSHAKMFSEIIEAKRNAFLTRCRFMGKDPERKGEPRQMSRDNYVGATKLLSEAPAFETLIMAALQTGEHERLRRAYPEIVKELESRKQERGGILPGEDGHLAG